MWNSRVSKGYVVLGACLLAAGTGATSLLAEGGPKSLTLGEAVALALRHNPGLVAAGHASAGAAEEVEQARARFVPRVDLTETVSRTDNPTMVFSNLLGQARFGPANFAIPSLNEPDPLTNFNGRIMLTQPLFTGGQLRAGLTASRHGATAARAQEERARQETIFRTTRAYHGVLLARQQARVAEAAHDAAAAHLKTAEALVASGLAVPSDVMRVRVRLAEIEEMRIRARSGESVARAALEAVMGAAPEGPYDLVEAGEEPDPPPEVEAASRESLARRPDLAAAREGASAASQAARAAKGGRLPQAGFMAAYEINNDTLIGSSGRNWTAMLSVNFNAFDGLAAGSRVRQTREEEARAASLVAGFESQVAFEARQAHAELAGAQARRDAARSAASQAEEGLRIVRDRYENGLATITDLLDQEAALTGARARAAQADYDCRDGSAALRLAMGTLGVGPEEIHP